MTYLSRLKSLNYSFIILCSFFLLTFITTGMFAQTSTPKTGTVITKKVLDNGLTVIIKPEPGSGLVAIAAIVRAGAAQESIQTAGIGDFVSHMLLAGTRLSSAEEVSSIADEVGGNIGSQWQPDFTNIQAVTTSAKFNTAMSLIGESLTEANFESKWVEQTRNDLLRSIKYGRDDVFDRAYTELRQLLYEDNSYRRPYKAMERLISSVTPESLKKFYSAYYVPNNIIISIAGDVTVEQAVDRVEKAFAGIPSARLPIDRGMPDESLDRCRFHASEEELSTAYLLISWLAPGISSPDYPAVMVAANALGGGKGSMMFQELRQKQGMGYDIGIMYPRLKYQSHVLAYVVTDPFKTSFGMFSPSIILDDVKTALLGQVDNLKQHQLSSQDLERAKGYTIGTYALGHQHLFDRAFILGWLEAVGVGYDFDKRFPDQVQKVTAEDVQRVAHKYFGNYAAVLLLPKAQPESGR